MKKRRATCVLSAVLFLFTVFSLAAPAAAQTTASDYFAVTDTWATRQTGNKILVEYDVNATHTMLEVGVKKIYIYEEQSDGDYDNVYTYTRDEHPEFIETNTPFAGGWITYQGKANVKYFATVAFYAKNANGAETLYFDTNVV